MQTIKDLQEAILDSNVTKAMAMFYRFRNSNGGSETGFYKAAIEPVLADLCADISVNRDCDGFQRRTALDILDKMVTHNVTKKYPVVLGGIESDFGSIYHCDVANLILRNEGYNVINLGLDIAAETFLDAAIYWRSPHIIVAADLEGLEENYQHIQALRRLVQQLGEQKKAGTLDSRTQLFVIGYGTKDDTDSKVGTPCYSSVNSVLSYLRNFDK